EGQIDNPLTLNLYTYVGNNPLTRTDPTGHSWCTFILCGPENAAQNYEDAKALYNSCDFCQAAMDYVGPEVGLAVGTVAVAKKSPSFFKKVWSGVKGVFSKTSEVPIRNLIDNAQDIADDIININKQYSNGNEAYNSISSIINSASYYENEWDQVSSVTRSITQHAFENGNKRTGFDTLNMLLNDMKLDSPLSDSQKWDLIDNIANGVIDDVSDISRVLQGN
ncbi:hypothetical protein, partial [Paenibacillus alba]